MHFDHSNRALHEILVLQEVRVRDIRVAADIGVYAHEIGRQQTLIVNVRLRLTPFDGDSLEVAVDYNDVVSRVQALAESRIALIETFARRVASGCLEYSQVLEVEVIVEKPGALPNGVPSATVLMSRPKPV